MRLRHVGVLMVLAVLVFAVAAGAKTFEHALSPGWNFVSLPFDPTDKNPETMFKFYNGAAPAASGYRVLGVKDGVYAEASALGAHVAGRRRKVAILVVKDQGLQFLAAAGPILPGFHPGAVPQQERIGQFGRARRGGNRCRAEQRQSDRGARNQQRHFTNMFGHHAMPFRT